MTGKNWLVGLVLACSLFAGCVPPPTAAFVQKSDAVEEQFSRGNKVLLLCDVSVRHEAKRFVVDDSQRAEGYLIAEAQANLAKKGFEMVPGLSPFVGGFKTPKGEFAVSLTEGQEARTIKPPFFQDAVMESDAQYRDALLYIEYFVQLCFDRGFNRGARFSVNPKARESLKIIAERAGVDLIVVVNADGNYVPTAKSVAQGLATGILTGVLTLGTVVVVAYDISHLDSYVAVLDARDGQMVWSNSLRYTQRHPQDERCYKDWWAHQLLYHLPARTGPSR